MVRLNPGDFEDAAAIARMAASVQLAREESVARFGTATRAHYMV
jgi:hypothetical protein